MHYDKVIRAEDTRELIPKRKVELVGADITFPTATRQRYATPYITTIRAVTHICKIEDM